LVGLAVGLTMIAKFTGVFIVLVLCLIAAFNYWLSRDKATSARSLRRGS